MHEYIEMWKNYANFKDRTSVRGYWMTFLINFAFTFCLMLLEAFGSMFVYLSAIYTLATIVPMLAILVRRLRDAGKHWSYIFFGFIPFVGTIMLIVFLCGKSVPAEDGSVQV